MTAPVAHLGTVKGPPSQPRSTAELDPFLCLSLLLGARQLPRSPHLLSAVTPNGAIVNAIGLRHTPPVARPERAIRQRRPPFLRRRLSGQLRLRAMLQSATFVRMPLLALGMPLPAPLESAPWNPHLDRAPELCVSNEHGQRVAAAAVGKALSLSHRCVQQVEPQRHRIRHRGSPGWPEYADRDETKSVRGRPAGFESAGVVELTSIAFGLVRGVQQGTLRAMHVDRRQRCTSRSTPRTGHALATKRNPESTALLQVRCTS
ncbi:uncharacterized protein BDZ99DRAFT_518891 [Mytilinidion resinicola]|uniref:Uncharacterized protein n=1 Tax=Mytilinidion resinicola TaxID=574789 RepID=A0A6A6YSU7_9PEZI|nr:uncharacterized protein BDZ99DRAFT_518891 [Mytilinidion resinicola]KAF2811638.1 hypothetical protein BDZ99DRAFT_518891 [Mytilinidion resinicola]